MTDRRDRPEHFWETWLRRLRERRCKRHVFPEHGVMRYGDPSFGWDLGNVYEESWSCCRRCGHLDIQIKVGGIPLR